jgi:hypothetical protein
MRLAFAGLAVVLLASVFAAPSAARAQTISSPYRFVEERQEVGFFAGYLSAGKGRFGFGPPGGLWLGGRYGLELTGPLSIEAVLGAVSGTRDVISPGRPEGEGAVGQGDFMLATIDGRLKFSLAGQRSWHGLSPFLIAGGGVVVDGSGNVEANTEIEADEVFEFGTSFFGTMGAGTRWFLSPRVAVRFDALFSLWKLKTPVGFGDPQYGFGAVQEGEWVSGLSITGSLLYRW